MEYISLYYARDLVLIANAVKEEVDQQRDVFLGDAGVVHDEGVVWGESCVDEVMAEGLEAYPFAGEGFFQLVITGSGVYPQEKVQA